MMLRVCVCVCVCVLNKGPAAEVMMTESTKVRASRHPRKYQYRASGQAMGSKSRMAGDGLRITPAQ